jgi:hypothetical protein
MLMGVFDWFCPESGETSGSALVNQHRWRGLSDVRSGNGAVVPGGPCGFDLGRGAHPERGVAAPGVVEQDVVVDRGSELDPGLPAPAVEIQAQAVHQAGANNPQTQERDPRRRTPRLEERAARRPIARSGCSATAAMEATDPSQSSASSTSAPAAFTSTYRSPQFVRRTVCSVCRGCVTLVQLPGRRCVDAPSAETVRARRSLRTVLKIQLRTVC